MVEFEAPLGLRSDQHMRRVFEWKHVSYSFVRCFRCGVNWIVGERVLIMILPLFFYTGLPVWQARDDIMRMINENQTIILEGETGSGKTTQIPQFIWDAGYTNGGKKIAITQPHRFTTLAAAHRVAVQRGVRLGEEVGYSIRFEECSSAHTQVK
jgi:type IV secretory pathway ATPase VirB11/archaellum biosynthesis ATPase